MPGFKTATITKHETPASTYHDVIIQAHESLDYKPGQYISIKVADKRINAYSLAGKLPDNQFGLIIDVKPGGPGSQYFANCKVGDTMEFIGPLGNFYYHPEDQIDHLIFLGTGSGIAPLKAMIEVALREQNCQTPMTLYFGLRHNSDIFWDDYLKSLADAHANLTYKLCLSKPEEGWPGACGHITDFLKQDFQDASKSSAYLCGNERMIQEGKDILISLGMPEQRIYHEKFF